MSGTQSGDRSLVALAARLPPGWRLDGAPGAGELRLRAPDGRVARLAVVRRKSLEPRDALVLAAATGGGLAGTLVTAPFLGPRTRELLRAAGASYADATGNVRLTVERPGVFVEAEGARRDPQRTPRPLASLKGPAAARVVRALCDVGPPYGVRRLAGIAAAAPASVSRVVSLLEREALVERGTRDEVLRLDWAGLLRRWSQDYQLLTSNEATGYLEPRGPAALLEKLATFRERAVVTGSLAAARRAPVAASRLAVVYVEDVAGAARALGLRAAESGANVMLVRPFDAVAFDRTWTDQGLTYAALSQVVADLLSSPGRAPSEGEELLAWMEKNPGAWRA